VRTFFVNYFPKIKKLNKSEELDPYSEVLDWFKNKELFIDENLDNKSYNDTFKTIKVLKKFVKNHIPKIDLRMRILCVNFCFGDYRHIKK